MSNLTAIQSRLRSLLLESGGPGEAAEKLGVSAHKIQRMCGGQGKGIWPGERATASLIEDCLEQEERREKRDEACVLDLQQRKTLREWLKDLKPGKAGAAPDGRTEERKQALVRSIGAGTLTGTQEIEAFFGTLSSLEQVTYGNELLQALTASSPREDKTHVFDEALDIVRRKVKEQSEDIATLRKDSRKKLASLVLHYLEEITGESKQPADPIAWLDEEEKLFKLLLPARSKLGALSWPAPYKKEWAFQEAERFSARYGADGVLDADLYRSKLESLDRASQPSEHPFLKGRSEEMVGDNPGAPIHRFYRASAFLFDVRVDASLTLARATCSLDEKGGHAHISPRLSVVAPRIVAGLVATNRLAANPYAVVADVAITHMNSHVKLRTSSFAHAAVGGVAVGLDGYSLEGEWDYDGLHTVAEDGRWLLLRSNHASKAMKISVLCITSDERLCMRLNLPHIIYDTPNWAPLLVYNPYPGDFRDKLSLVEGCIASVKSCIRRNLPDAPAPSCYVTGFALNAGSGLQPNIFCLVQLGLTEEEVKLRLPGSPLRFHSLIADNPAVSLAEAYSMRRYAECDVLRAAIFATWRWLIDGAHHCDKESIGLDSLDLAQERLHDVAHAK